MITREGKSFSKYLQYVACGIAPTMPIPPGAAGSGHRHAGAVDKLGISSSDLGYALRDNRNK